jgi:predicted acyltransferase
MQTINNRLLSLDVLRGMAILLMVLSGSIAFADFMPAWMFHAQVPPPKYIFNLEIAGITWVDLVFPFFLFSMGAAFPLALNIRLEKLSMMSVLFQVVKRYILLVFFAIFIFHGRAWVMSERPGLIENLFSIGCFFLLFLMFSKTSFESKTFSTVRQFFAFVIAIFFLLFYPFKGNGFDVFHSDIIIIVLANMALFGSVIWLFTKQRPWLRLAILPLVMGIFLSGKVDGSWVNKMFNWSPIPWAYTFYYLKYLFIIIPGTFAGDWFLEAKARQLFIKTSSNHAIIALLAFLLVIINIILLFTRELNINIILTIGMSAGLLFFCKQSALPPIYKNFALSGVFMLIVGLVFEPYEGGIKKDPSTYSYYFVTSGMAFLTILSLLLIEASGYFRTSFKLIAKVGQNPMIAYTCGSLFLLPLLKISYTEAFLNSLNINVWGGFIRGLIFTTIVALITIFFTSKRIFWKT